MATTKKALVVADELVAELTLRLPALAVSRTFDTDSNPLIQVGAGTAGAKGGVIKILPQPWPLALDVLGNASAIYTPHVVRIGLESNPTGGAGADVNDLPTLMAILGAVALRGMRVELYSSNNGTAPTASTLTGTLVTSFEPSLQYPMISNQ